MVDHVADNDEHALDIVRPIVASLNPPSRRDSTAPSREPPRYDPAELYGIVPADVARALRRARGDRPHRRRLASSTSSSRSTARRWSPASRTSGAIPVAILANNGVLFSESALKGAHFIELACQRGIPLVFLQNISGFMVGGKYEAGGIAKDGAKTGDGRGLAPRCRSSPC